MNNGTKRLVFDLSVWIASLLIGLVLIAHQAMAGSTASPSDNGRWKAECGSCHIAYPARFLPAPAWQRIMSGLDKHFGTDASVDAGALAEIGTFLERNAGRDRRAQGSAGTLRITETAWFRHEHDEVPAASWTQPAVKSPANCAACHRSAAEGDFRERSIRVPR